MSINKYSYVVSYEFLNETSKLYKMPIDFNYEDYCDASAKFRQLSMDACDHATCISKYSARITMMNDANQIVKQITIS